MVKTEFNNDVGILCDMQIDMWNDIKNTLAAMNNPTDEEISAMIHKHMSEDHHEAVLQLIKVKMTMDEME